MGYFDKLFQKYYQEMIVFWLIIVAYFPTFLWMVERWFVPGSYYNHGIIVPAFSLFLIWQKRDVLAVTVRQESPLGIWLIIFGLLIHLVSSFLRIYFTSACSLIIVFLGFVLYFKGSKYLKVVLFPILFLVFMIPIPLVVVTNFSVKLKVFAAYLATLTLNDFRIPAIQEVNLIKMRTAEVLVDDACSGLRSLISLTALGSIFGYWFHGPLYKRILIFLSSIPIAVIVNAGRIIFLSAVSEIWGVQYAEGFVHDLTGFLVYVFAFLLLYIVGRLIE